MERERVMDNGVQTLRMEDWNEKSHLRLAIAFTVQT